MKALTLLTISILAVAHTALAAIDSREVISTSNPKSMGINTAILQNGIYTVEETVRVVPRAEATKGNLVESTEFVEIKKHRPFAVYVEGQNVYLMPMVAKEFVGKKSDTYAFAPSDLADVKFSFVMPGDQYTLYENFAQVDEVQVAGACKRLTQRHLGFKVPGICATDVSDAHLANVGFYPADCGSAQLLLWAGGHSVKRHPAPCGHMAWRTASGAITSGDMHGDPGSRYYGKRCYSRSGGGFSFANAQTTVRSARVSAQQNNNFFSFFNPQPEPVKAKRHRRHR